MSDEHSHPPPLPPHQPLSYVSANVERPPAGSIILRFFFGLVAGSAVSAIVWIAGWHALMDKGYAGSYAMLIVPAVKLVAGIVCLCFRGWRSLGAGILVSIAIGFLVFFGACAMNMKGI